MNWIHRPYVRRRCIRSFSADLQSASSIFWMLRSSSDSTTGTLSTDMARRFSRIAWGRGSACRRMDYGGSWYRASFRRRVLHCDRLLPGRSKHTIPRSATRRVRSGLRCPGASRDEVRRHPALCDRDGRALHATQFFEFCDRPCPACRATCCADSNLVGETEPAASLEPDPFSRLFMI